MGNSGKVLRQAYNPFLIQDILTDQNLPFPETSRIPPATTAEKWLRKPFRSTGGHGIASLSLPDASTVSVDGRSNKDIYFQRFLDGPCYSATFLASGHTCDLLGVTRQLVGKQFTNGPSFGYCGSIGPISLTGEQKSTLDRIGQVLTATIPLRGLFGIDFVWHAGQAWTLEINPRFPASVEILDLAFGLSATGLHCQACLNPKEVFIRPPATNLQYGKAIIYAREPCTITTDNYEYWINRTALQRTTSSDPCSWFADIPMVGTRISVGHPILTVMAQDEN
ncbi:MAG: ATP-grasp domain-containing protein, partial [Planctomycetaceae bacterium]|nr:ATP-grasp domain-containing protein [Planctomycetaceae bacterium]